MYPIFLCYIVSSTIQISPLQLFFTQLKFSVDLEVCVFEVPSTKPCFWQPGTCACDDPLWHLTLCENPWFMVSMEGRYVWSRHPWTGNSCRIVPVVQRGFRRWSLLETCRDIQVQPTYSKNQKILVTDGKSLRLVNNFQKRGILSTCWRLIPI
jgi:hypothetical protein